MTGEVKLPQGDVVTRRYVYACVPHNHFPPLTLWQGSIRLHCDYTEGELRLEMRSVSHAGGLAIDPLPPALWVTGPMASQGEEEVPGLPALLAGA